LSVLLLGVILCVPVQADAIQSHPNAAALVRAFAVEPAGDFEPTGIDSDDYLRLISGNVDYFRQHQAESGAIIDPVSKGERQYSTPAFALAAGVLAAEAGRDDLLEPAAAAMSHALGALVEGRAADGHPDFYAPLLVHAFRVLEGKVPEARAQAWGRQFERIEPESIYRMDLRRMNWNVVSSSGELLRRHDGLVAPDRREA